jgi:hypothetical protein
VIAVAYEAVAIRNQVRELGLSADVDYSPIWGSPFRHVFVFLTEARRDGRLVQISPERELVPDAPADSLIVAERSNVDDVEAEGQVLASPDELMAWLADHRGAGK